MNLALHPFRFGKIAWALLLLTASCASSAHADLQGDVNTVLADKLLKKTTVGIEVYRVGANANDLKEILNLQPLNPLLPASNLKVATTSAALDTLGPNFHFRTELILHNGNLILIGDGDPTFGDAEYLRKAGWGVTTVFDNWAAQLKKLNIASIKDVLVDDSVFDDKFFNPNWPGDARRPQYEKRFEAEVAGVNLNANCVDFLVQPAAPGQPVTFTMDPNTAYVTVKNECITSNTNAVRLNRQQGSNQITLAGKSPANGASPVSITVHDPSLFAATVLSESLSRAGINITGSVKRDRTQRAAREANWQVIGIHETPLAPVLARCNKDSMNVYAESLCKRLGYNATHQSGSWDNGTAAVGAFLKKAGVSPAEFKLDDGSGLSRANGISPHALAQVLVYDHFSPNSEMFFDSLSIAGVDGTLDDRFRERDLRDLRKRVFGKSGFIEGVSTVCGYLKAKNGNLYVFSIMMNGIPHESNSEIKVLQEKIIKAVDVNAK